MPIIRATDTEALFEAMAPGSFVVTRTPVIDPPYPLPPAERDLTTSMAPRRLACFAAGRAAAGAALLHLGLPRDAILVGPGGAPVWPSGVIGSISHTDHVAYAVVAIEDHVSDGAPALALGIDVEDRRRVDQTTIASIMTEPERAIWATLDPERADAFATVAFSVKEALYKAQFAFTGAWLGFEHVALADDPTGARLVEQEVIDIGLIETAGSPLDHQIERPLRARSILDTDLVVSAVVLRRQASPERSD